MLSHCVCVISGTYIHFANQGKRAEVSTERERSNRYFLFLFWYFQFHFPVFAMLHVSSLVSVAKSRGQGLQIHHNYSNLSPPHHRATTECLPHICLEVAATLLHNQLRFNYRAMIATSSNKEREKRAG